jgi:hypothetical protein
MPTTLMGRPLMKAVGMDGSAPFSEPPPSADAPQGAISILAPGCKPG